MNQNTLNQKQQSEEDFLKKIEEMYGRCLKARKNATGKCPYAG